MRRLLRANFARLWKDRVLWITTAVVCLFGGSVCISQYNAMINYDVDMSGEFPRIFLNSYLMLPMALAAFTNLFLGTEYSDGTIRNKLVTGCTRNDIYLSGYVTCAAAGIFMQACYSLVVSVIAIPMFGFKAEFLKIMGIGSCVGALLICSEVAMYTCVSMLCQNKAAVAVLCQVGTFALLMLGSYLANMLTMPEFYDAAKKMADGTIVMEQVRNERYLTGSARQWYQFWLDFIPQGQGYTIGGGMGTDHPALLGVYSLIVIAGANLAGLLGFRRKDLK